MKIALIVTPWYSIPPKNYGGIERFVFDLIKAQNKKHHITIYASGDSLVPRGIFLKSFFKKPLFDKGYDRTVELTQALYSISDTIKYNYDIIHVHNLYQTLPLLINNKIPIIFTHHCIVKPEIRDLCNVTEIHKLKKIKHIFLTKSHKQQWKNIFDGQVINLGIDINDFPFFPNKLKKNRIIFVGDISKNKGIIELIDAIEKIKIKLIIAGPIKAVNKYFFEKEIYPKIKNNKLIDFVGEINDSTRNKLIGTSKLFILPSIWQEPFGRVILESLAVGTPVIAFNKGSAREIIKSNIGMLIDNKESLVNGINIAMTKTYNAYVCRQYVQNNFSIDEVMEKYNKIYKTMV